jgi:hypothetical protein
VLRNSLGERTEQILTCITLALLIFDKNFPMSRPVPRPMVDGN